MIQDKTIIGIVGICAVVILQCMAWASGHNGQVFALTSAVIGGITGFSVRDRLITKKKEIDINGYDANEQE